MKRLLKEYSFNSDFQYYEMIAESFLNGQRKQAIDQFKSMPKTNKIAMLKAATIGNWVSGLQHASKIDLFDNL